MVLPNYKDTHWFAIIVYYSVIIFSANPVTSIEIWQQSALYTHVQFVKKGNLKYGGPEGSHMQI